MQLEYPHNGDLKVMFTNENEQNQIHIKRERLKEPLFCSSVGGFVFQLFPNFPPMFFFYIKITRIIVIIIITTINVLTITTIIVIIVITIIISADEEDTGIGLCGWVLHTISLGELPFKI